MHSYVSHSFRTVSLHCHASDGPIKFFALSFQFSLQVYVPYHLMACVASLKHAIAFDNAYHSMHCPDLKKCMTSIVQKTDGHNLLLYPCTGHLNLYYQVVTYTYTYMRGYACGIKLPFLSNFDGIHNYTGGGICYSRWLLILSFLTPVLAFSMWFYSSGYFHSIIVYNVYLPFSKGLQPCPSTFVGRINEIHELTQLMEQVGKIIHIVGPPGFGKSTLAICVGNSIISKGIVVRHVDMTEVTHQPVQQVMAEKILYQESTHSDMINVTFDHLLSWSGRLSWHYLIIFDNCDEPLNNQRDQFNEAIEKFVKQSNKIKVLVTSREESLFVEMSRAVKVDSLSIDEACDLLDQKSPGILNMNEKIAIANLTGSVPLALQIVGSLLNKRLNPPTPSVIIEELRHQPIPTLSPSDLNRKMRINASISVSYNYLEPRLKKLARYLANFPGSFTKSMASAVLRSISSNIVKVTEDYIVSSLGKLVTRSLLEYNSHSERYHFHYLLREFFRDIQLKHHREERGRFVLAFQIQISTMLREMTELFAVSSPKKALSLLDSERHNVEHLLKITHRPYNCSHKAYSAAVTAIDLAITFKFLSCRFSTKELYEPVSSITFVMRSKVIRSATDYDAVLNSNAYVHFTNHNAMLLSELKGMKAAANWLMTNVVTIEKTSERLTDPNLQNKMATLYNTFYINLLMYEQYIDEERVRVYNTRILQKTIQLQPDTEKVDFTCEHTANKCPYKSIATAYYHIKKYKKSIQFLEKALQFEDLGLSDYVTLSIYLVNSYESIGDHEKAKDAFEWTIMHIYTSVLQSPSTLVILTYRRYVRMLRSYGETQKALKLERKELNELLETGAKGGFTEARRAYDFARQLFDQENYTEAIAMATLALRIMEPRNNVNVLWPKLKVLIGKAKYRSGNSTGSVVVFKEVADWIMDQETTNEYKQEYFDACSYLIFHTKYLHECYLKKLDSVGTFIVTTGLACVYYLVVPPLDLYVNKEQQTQAMNHFEQLMSESGIKDILLHTEGKGPSALTTTFHYSDSEENIVHSESPLVQFLKFAFNFALHFVIIRAMINVILIVIKLCTFAATLFCIYQCLSCCGCGCCFCCCHLISRCTSRLIQSLSILYTYVAIEYFDN